MSFPEKKVLRRPELDAFIITAISPELVNQEFTQEVQVQFGFLVSFSTMLSFF